MSPLSICSSHPNQTCLLLSLCNYISLNWFCLLLQFVPHGKHRTTHCAKKKLFALSSLLWLLPSEGVTVSRRWLAGWLASKLASPLPSFRLWLLLLFWVLCYVVLSRGVQACAALANEMQSGVGEPIYLIHSVIKFQWQYKKTGMLISLCIWVYVGVFGTNSRVQNPKFKYWLKTKPCPRKTRGTVDGFQVVNQVWNTGEETTTPSRVKVESPVWLKSNWTASPVTQVPIPVRRHLLKVKGLPSSVFHFLGSQPDMESPYARAWTQ